ncbi:MAG: lipoprotein-releasing ABC transporter ATP-binding protein LolD [Gammaproteobacteria bacterium]|nr:lipoprotein-releasing ABC transporter ATP-binding protein LolD [Gammaproteobacteria bacterium]
MNNDFVIQCQSVAKYYSDADTKVEVLSDISLNVKPGELIAIVGASGSGKSTLMHLLGGLDRASSGEVLVAGKSLATLNESEKAKMRNQYLGFVYQFHHLLPEFTALENVSLPLLIRGISVSEILPRAEQILTAVGLSQRMTHKPGELSGGERQRVAIARALITKPLCILADEPTGNLDPRNAEKVYELFVKLQKEQQTAVVIVTHNLHIARQADRTLTLENGVLV